MVSSVRPEHCVEPKYSSSLLSCFMVLSEGFSEKAFEYFTSTTCFNDLLASSSGLGVLKVDKSPAVSEGASSSLDLLLGVGFWYVPHADDSLRRLSFLPSALPPP